MKKQQNNTGINGEVMNDGLVNSEAEWNKVRDLSQEVREEKAGKSDRSHVVL